MVSSINLLSMVLISKKKLGLQPPGVRFYGPLKNSDPKIGYLWAQHPLFSRFMDMKTDIYTANSSLLVWIRHFKVGVRFKFRCFNLKVQISMTLFRNMNSFFKRSRIYYFKMWSLIFDISNNLLMGKPCNKRIISMFKKN